MKKIEIDFVDDAQCVKDGCTLNAIRQFRWSVGTKFCMCPQHSDEEIRKERLFDVFDQDKEDRRRKLLENRIMRCGIPENMVSSLNIFENCQGIAETGAMTILSDHRGAENRGVLVLSGHNGVGKSFGGAWIAWQSRGRYLRRSDWASLTTWSKDYDELIELRDCAGTLVFDEVLQNNSESPETVKALNIIACERHDNGRSTVLITRSTRNDIFRVFGNDILDRARQYQDSRSGSGFFELEGRSRR